MGIMTNNMQTTENSESQEDSMLQLQESLNSLWAEGNPIDISSRAKKYVIKDFPQTNINNQLGWVQLNKKKEYTSIGLFKEDGKKFLQLAVADSEGRIFLGSKLSYEDIQDMRPQLSFVEKNNSSLKDLHRFYGKQYKKTKITLKCAFSEAFDETYTKHTDYDMDNIVESYLNGDATVEDFLASLESSKSKSALKPEQRSKTFAGKINHFSKTFSKIRKENVFCVSNGDLVLQLSEDNGLIKIGSWISHGFGTKKTYTLEELRTKLPENLRCNLTYRNAITIAFFAALFIPDMHKSLTGFGYSNVLRRLEHEAPLGAIRRSVEDIKIAKKENLRVSGLEEYFEKLMRSTGALETERSLEAVHGAERLHMQKSQQTEANYLLWDDALEPNAALKVLKIEGAINRLYSIYDCLQINSIMGGKTCENTIKEEQASQIDMAMIKDAAFAASGSIGMQFFGNPLMDDKIRPILHMWRRAKQVKNNDKYFNKIDNDSEWSYRQRLSNLIRSIYLPFRFDAEFRSNLEDGNVAINLTTAGAALMPSVAYVNEDKSWKNLNDDDKEKLATNYNLQVGMIMSTLAFGASGKVKNVSIRLDSIGLEEMVTAQNNAMNNLVNRTLNALNVMNSDAANNDSSKPKGDPKDGDIHGDPSKLQEMQQTNISNANKTNNNVISIHASASSQELNAETGTNADSNENQLSENSMDKSKEENSFAAFTTAPSIRALTTVTFSRDRFIKLIHQNGLNNPIKTYEKFNAKLNIDSHGKLNTIEPDFDVHSSRFSPHGSQEEPEFSDKIFTADQESILGTQYAQGLSIQREDLLQQAVADFHHIASELMTTTAQKAHEAMSIIESIDDPELNAQADSITRALIDEIDLPNLSFTAAKRIRDIRTKAHEQFMNGDLSEALKEYENSVAQFDTMFTSSEAVPRYFNSYAERVIYNHLFATKEERTRLIPDGLFYAHMELADLLSQLNQHDEALRHLNIMVSYAPTYALSHLRLADILAQKEDWSSVIAACINALNVSLDRDDAAFAYYKLAYAEWMQNNFLIAASSYRMAQYLAPGKIEPLEMELDELLSRMRSQCKLIPRNIHEAQMALLSEDIPAWPDIEAEEIIDKAAKLTVNDGMFVIARTLCVANIRMTFNEDLSSTVQTQFLRSLNA